MTSDAEIVTVTLAEPMRAQADPNTRILVVDDEMMMRMIVRRILKQMGVEQVVEAPSGTQALARLRAEAFHSVVLDWSMPDLSGVEVLKAVRADAALRTIPVLMVTGESTKAKVEEAIGAGADAYIVKPFAAQVFETKMRALLRTRPSPAPAPTTAVPSHASTPPRA